MYWVLNKTIEVGNATVPCNGTQNVGPFGWCNNTWGFIAAVFSICMFGSFTINFKFGSLQRTGFDPMVMQIWMNLAIGTSSLIVISYEGFHWSNWGILSGGLWLLCNMMAIVAIQNIGISISQGVWSGSTIIVSFIWGAAIFHQTPASIGLSILALVVLCIGIAGISIAGTDLLGRKAEETSGLLETPPGSVQELGEIIPEPMSPRKKMLLGFASAFLLGIPNGSVYAPLNPLIKEDEIWKGATYLPSFGLGLLIVTPVFALPYFFLFLRKQPDWNWKVLPLRACLAGIMWNAGNWSSLYALQYLGYTVGFPLVAF
jgi:glucose uptake protein GlcU